MTMKWANVSPDNIRLVYRQVCDCANELGKLPFISPEETSQSGIPNCPECNKDYEFDHTERWCLCPD